MRKILVLAAAAALLPSYAAAQTAPSGFYGELGIGLSLLQDVKTEQFSRDIGIGTLAGTLNNKYSSPQGMFGAELGFATRQWRFGISYDWTDAPIDEAQFSGTFDGTPINVQLSQTELDAFGFESDTGFMVTAGNIYYSFSPTRSSVEPYIGLGAGAAVVQNASTELALSATAGARFAISPRAYVGARYRFIYVAGPEDDVGVKYENVFLHTVSVQLGLFFGSS